VIPHFSRLLETAPAATYMLVRSGTSRLVILDGRNVRAGAGGRTDVLRIMLGADGHGGLGGPTLQDNKVALVWAEQVPAQFRFRFLQVIPSLRVALPMECSNSASAAAMLAQLSGHHRGLDAVCRAVNLSTGQRIELRPNREHAIADAWAVRFLASARTRRSLAGLAGKFRVRLAGRSVEFHPVLLGNLFLFAAMDPGECDAATAAPIARAGMRAARASGFRAPHDYHPKVIPYRVASTGGRPEVHAASYYHGELHRSFPGSAAMALCAFLACSKGREAAALDHWRVRHPSGVIDVALSFDASHRVPRLEWTEFVTPVSLLAWGAAATNWHREH
jgi:hypothetical protein